MLTHGQVWRAIDQLAEQHGLSTSALARRAGLDPTTFNRSKRVTTDGRPRWPSTESIAKALAATGTSAEHFFALLAPDAARGAPAGFEEESLPLKGPIHAIRQIGFAQAGSGGFFDDAGFPVGAGWDEIAFPEVEDAHAYALEIAGDSMQPVYRDGDIVVVSPAASVRRGDRVVLKTRDGEVLAKELVRKTTRHVELRSLNPAHEDRQIPLDQVDWMARIIWASQ
ncbi:helix-turn-helix transcriptional regulator [Xanthobacter dioxanivorans]|uniref:Helix-turn-helix transcriptional regulator n=1 Tax=Xanthobacter dioxanivorans TaxID=2528964 RepID=A0A974PN85_9HYPH|nr:helix-turn-helix transcriptional regulator [Xanthobacter dioxanivorans]QRG06441.1 helix-turn-helix transcriptional regulator [Xanthobacter dioxanivorans]